MAPRRQPYHQTFHFGLLLLCPGWELLFRSFQASTLSVHAGKFFEWLVRPLRLIVLVRWSNGINYFLMARAGIRLISIIWSSASSMSNLCVPSYYQPQSSWRERRISIRLTLCCQPLRAELSGCSDGQRCWSIHTLQTITKYHTRDLWTLASWVAAVLWRQTHIMGWGRRAVLLLRNFMRLWHLCAKMTLMASVF